jgi:hypothetical protein
LNCLNEISEFLHRKWNKVKTMEKTNLILDWTLMGTHVLTRTSIEVNLMNRPEQRSDVVTKRMMQRIFASILKKKLQLNPFYQDFLNREQGQKWNFDCRPFPNHKKMNEFVSNILTIYCVCSTWLKSDWICCQLENGHQRKAY